MRTATAAILVIGDEILSGKVSDENARFLIGELRALGVALRRIVVIPDALDEIAAHARILSDNFDHVFTSGGVGPTHDDLTMEGVARAFGTTVVRHPELERTLRGYYGEKLEERNLRMADVPDGAALVAEPGMHWPVVAYKNVYILPGVPEIFRRKFQAIRERFRQAPFHTVAVLSSADEGAIAGELDAVAAGWPDVALGSYPRMTDGGWRVRLTLESKDRARVDEALADLVRRLGTSVVGVEG